jgi:hypothetical protein
MKPRDGQKESRDEQKQASDIPTPRTLADIEPLYKLSKKPCAEVLEPDPSEKFDPWTDWQKDQLPVVQETPTADNEAGGDWQNWGLAEQPARPKPLSDVEPYYKLRRTGNVENAEATEAAPPEQD